MSQSLDAEPGAGSSPGRADAGGRPRPACFGKGLGDALITLRRLRQSAFQYFAPRFMALLLLASSCFGAAGAAVSPHPAFPPPLESYSDSGATLWQRISGRAAAEPLNVAATVIFLLAIIHTFLAPKIMHLAHRWRDEHAALLAQRPKPEASPALAEAAREVSFRAEIAHFFGEVEAIFGIWVIPLIVAFVLMKDWATARNYISHTVRFTEPLFVVVIMTIAATRPVMQAANNLMTALARLAGGGPAATWFAILTLGPLLGSFITEPAAMTICALLLSRKFYEGQPSRPFAYATLGLLFVNISIGGTLTHFAAPPVLMVAERWGWNAGYMMSHFGWKAAVSIAVSNALYYFIFRRSFAALKLSAAPADDRGGVPLSITVVHLLFLAWTVFTAHESALFIGGFLFFLAFTAATEHHQSPIVLRPALLVGFFLAGLVIHGGLQSWWIAPVIGGLTATPLFFGAVALTSVNDNAAITFLASLVPNLEDALKYAVVAGAVTGGGLTVIANAPNPAGQSILNRYFEDGVSPLWLAAGAIPATVIATVTYLLFP